MKPYSPVRDGLWLASVALVVANKWWIKPHFSGWFWHASLNDLLCLPVWMPFCVWCLARLGLREAAPPRLLEIAVSWLLWSLVFEVVLPGVRVPSLGRFAPGDPLDVLAYGIGGFFGALWWEWLARRAKMGSGRNTI